MQPRYARYQYLHLQSGRSGRLKSWHASKKHRPGAAAISVITYGEFRFAAEKSYQRTEALQQLDELTSVLPVLPLPQNAADAYGAIRADLPARGETIGNNDLWIAAHAKSAALILVTNNEREFKRISGLKVQNWAKR